jgi:SSS family solute:Na+ symporter
VLVGRITAVTAIIIAIIMARPLLGKSEQAFQYIQEFSGFFTPGITVIFLLGLFWKRATEAGAITAAVTSVLLSTIMKYTLPAAAFSQGINDYLTPFINRMGVVFLVSLVLAVIVSLATPQRPDVDTIDTVGVRYKTSTGFNAGALGVILILIALYATWW